MSTICLVAAVDRQLAIGRRGDMPWHLPDDLRRFKRLTLDKPVLMGRKTALSIGRALPGRRNIVLSRAGSAPYEGQETVRNLQQAIALAGVEDLMVIGGGEIYALALPLASRLYLTHVDCAASDVDTFFPAFDRSQWRVVAREAHAVDERHAHAMEFVDYVRA